MKKIALLCAVMTLAACSGSEPSEAPASEQAAKTPEEAMPGTYEVTMKDGTKLLSSIAADHSYTDLVRGEVTEWGSWAITDGKTCFTPETEGAKPSCFTIGKAEADGIATATPDEGDPVKIRKLS